MSLVLLVCCSFCLFVLCHPQVLLSLFRSHSCTLLCYYSCPSRSLASASLSLSLSCLLQLVSIYCTIAARCTLAGITVSCWFVTNTAVPHVYYTEDHSLPHKRFSYFSLNHSTWQIAIERAHPEYACVRESALVRGTTLSLASERERDAREARGRCCCISLSCSLPRSHSTAVVVLRLAYHQHPFLQQHWVPLIRLISRIFVSIDR